MHIIIFVIIKLCIYLIAFQNILIYSQIVIWYIFIFLGINDVKDITVDYFTKLSQVGMLQAEIHFAKNVIPHVNQLNNSHQLQRTAIFQFHLQLNNH